VLQLAFLLEIVLFEEYRYNLTDCFIEEEREKRPLLTECACKTGIRKTSKKNVKELIFSEILTDFLII
jgi:hypothetical protein